MKVCFFFIDEQENEALKDDWINVYAALVGTVTPAFLKDVIIPKLTEMISLKSQLKRRKWGVQMLGYTCRKQSEETIMKDFKKLLLTCTYDQHWNIRKIIISHFNYICKHILSVETVLKEFSQEMIELLMDDDLIVQTNAAEALIDHLPNKFSDEQIDGEIIPEILKLFNNEYDDECNERMSMLFGSFIFNLPQEKFRKSYSSQFLRFFLKMARSNELVLRKNAAFNLPCIFYYYQSYCLKESLVVQDQADPLDLIEIYVEFANDENAEVKKIIARGIHEVVQLEASSERNPFDFQETLDILLKDQESSVLLSLVPNLSDIIIPISNYFNE